MIPALIFSRDRACQVDALLRSLYLHAPQIKPTVLYTTSGAMYSHAYEYGAKYHRRMGWVWQHDFQADVTAWLKRQRQVPGLFTFLTDDSLFYGDVGPEVEATMEESSVFSFSLRLGRNTNYCFPLDTAQALPDFYEEDDTLDWQWLDAEHDFSYPASLDGHVMRIRDFRSLVSEQSYSSPNELEDLLARNAKLLQGARPMMACYQQSKLVGIPINRVNLTHQNRFGERHPLGTDELNSRFLAGERIDLEALKINPSAAHEEIELVLK